MRSNTTLQHKVLRTHEAEGELGLADMLQYLKLIPNYALEVISLLLGPKRFLSSRDTSVPEHVASALLFFLISSGIALIFRAYGIESPTDFGTLLLRSALAWGAFLLVAAAIIAVAWAIVRRPVDVQAAFLIQAYVVSISLVVTNLSIAAEANLLAMYHPELYRAVRDIYRAENFDYGEVVRFTQSHQLASSDVVAEGIQVIQFIALATTFAWVIATWGAYRRLNGASRTRSTFAFIIAFILCIPVGMISTLITRHGFSLR